MEKINKEIKGTYSDGSWSERDYNVRGQVERVRYSSHFGFDNDRVFTYDDVMGRLVRDDKEDGQFIEYKYDISGNLIETGYSGGHIVYYGHDTLNRLATVTDEHGATSYTYDPVGNRKSMAYPNGTVAKYEYNSLNRLVYLENNGPNGIISSYKYTLGPAGNRMKIEEHNGDINEYQYDKLYRLTRESRTGDHAYWISYKYDAFGNRLEMNRNGAVTTYTYDDNDRMLTETGPADVTNYTWDNNGNMTGKTTPEEAWVYQWNYDNKLARADKNNALSASYSYDFRGERVRKNTSQGLTNFLIDNNNQTGYSQALRETDAANTELVAYTFGDDLISQNRTEPSFYHYDGLGSTRSVTSNQADITDTIDYIAFGSILNKTGTTDISHLFTGESYDFNLGFYHLRARLYDPESGKFLSQDIFSGMKFEPQSLHKYVYTHNNPANFIDPSGMHTLIELGIVTAILGILASLAWKGYKTYSKTKTCTDAGKFIYLTHYCAKSDDAKSFLKHLEYCKTLPVEILDHAEDYQKFFIEGGLWDCRNQLSSVCIKYICLMYKMDVNNPKKPNGEGPNPNPLAKYMHECNSEFPKLSIQLPYKIAKQILLLGL